MISRYLSSVFLIGIAIGCGDPFAKERQAHEAAMRAKVREIEAYHEAIVKEKEKEIETKRQIMLSEAKEADREFNSRFGIKPKNDLLLAIDATDLRRVETLLSEGADPNIRSPEGATPLVLASSKNSPEIVQVLLDAGANPNQTAKRDMTPLLVAAHNGDLQTTKILLEKGADLEIATQNGVTPLFAAVVFRHEDLAIYLLEKGARPEATNAVGASVLDIARKENLNLVVARIMEIEGKPSHDDSTTSSIPEGTHSDDGTWIEIAGANLMLVKPKDFELASNFSGFQNEAEQAAVLVARMPGPFQECISGFTNESLSKAGMSLKSRQELTHDQKQALLMHVTQPVEDVSLEKWILVFGDETETRMVTASFPEARSKSLSEIMKRTVLSAKAVSETQRDSEESPLKTKLFEISSLGRLKPVTSMSVGGTICLTKTGNVPTPSPADPIFVVGPSIRKVKTTHFEAYSRQRLNETAETRIESVESHEPITIDGLTGFETYALGRDKSTRHPIRIYQVMLFDENQYFLMQGLVGREDSEDVIKEFKMLARSFKRNK